MARKKKFWEDSREIATILFVLAGLMALLQAFTGLNNDTQILLHYASLMLDGGGLYTRWQEVNPPLVFVLYIFPAMLVKLGLGPAAALNLFTLALCGASVFATWDSLASLPRERRLGWTAACAFVLTASSAFCLVFTDREHLLFVFALPWILQMLLGQKPKPYTAVFAAPGFFLKPFNIIICAALLLCAGPPQSLKARIISPSALVFLGLGLLYIACALFFFSGYFTHTLPLVLTAYPEIGKSASNDLWRVLVFAGICYAFLARDKKPRYGVLALLLSCLGVYLLNGGWTYTLYLLLAPVLALAYLAFDAGRERAGAALVFGFVTLGSMAAALFNLYFTWQDGYAWNYPRPPDGLYARLRQAAGDEFVLLSPSLWATNVSALRDKPRHIYAYDYLWALPWLYAHPDHEKAPMARAMFADPLAAALAKNPVLIVEESRLLRSMPQNADVLREFRKDPAVKKALAGYKRTAEIDACRPDFQAICKFGVWTPLKTRHDR